MNVAKVEMTTEETLNYRKISEAIATSGQPVPGEIKLIAQAGFEVVINLTMPGDDTMADEGYLVAHEGMRYVHIPVDWKNPTITDIAWFFDFMQALEGKRVWIHCAKNMRVSCFVYLYRTCILRDNEEEAENVMKTVWNPADYPAWERLVQDVKAVYI